MRLARSVPSISVGRYRPLSSDWVGANANLTAVDQVGNHDTLVHAIRRLGINTLRYPGGTIGNYRNWDRG